MKKRNFIFLALLILILVGIGGVMMVIGRGHTVYFDNKSLEYEGQTYASPYKIEIYPGSTTEGDAVARLYEGERGSTQIGQKITVTLIVTQEKGGEETTSTYTIDLPYNMDGPVINLTAYLAGLPEEAYLSEFIPVVTEEADEEITDDDLGLGDDMGLGDF